ncbi:MAG: helix-turn-helix transcriptional regulator [Bacteroidota bacterium]
MTTFIKTINEFARLGQYESPRHPLMALLRIEEVGDRKQLIPEAFTFGFYTIGLKKNLKGFLKYGRKTYDFQEGVLVFTAPHQVISYEHLIVDESEGWYLLFEKSLLQNTSLAQRFENFKFFNYEINEALHLSKEEETQLNHIFEFLQKEYEKPIDVHSRQLLVSHLEMILNYSERYYQRQFITRNEMETSFLSDFERVLSSYCSLDRLSLLGIPSVKEIAQQLNRSPNYLSDAIRNSTGMGVQKHIHLRLIEMAKEQLLTHQLSVSEVAYSLGFDSHTYFSRLFKKMEGLTPSEFIRQN